MKPVQVILLLVVILPAVSGFDASLSFREDLQNVTNGSYSDAFYVENKAYPNGSPFTATVTSTTTYRSGNSDVSKKNVSVNKYSYSDTSDFTLTENVTAICGNVSVTNRTDTNQSNNHVCQTIQTFTSNTTGNGSNTSTSEQTTDDASANSSEARAWCESLVESPATVAGDDSLDFFINTSGGPVTYWVTGEEGTTVKDKYTTERTGDKQYTPTDLSWFVIHATADRCNTLSRGVGVTGVRTEPFVRIDDVSVSDDSLEIGVTRHGTSDEEVTVRVEQTSGERTVFKGALPSGTTSFTAVTSLRPVWNGLLTVTVEQGGLSDAFRVHVDKPSLSEKYGGLIESAYYRKEYFGPTTVYVTLSERVNGYLSADIGNRQRRTGINGSSAEITVIPDAVDDVVGLSVENDVGDRLDRSFVVLDLQRRTTDTGVETNESAASSDDHGGNESFNSTGFQPVHDQSSQTPWVGGAVLIGSFGYGVYRLLDSKRI